MLLIAYRFFQVFFFLHFLVLVGRFLEGFYGFYPE